MIWRPRARYVRARCASSRLERALVMHTDCLTEQHATPAQLMVSVPGTSHSSMPSTPTSASAPTSAP